MSLIWPGKGCLGSHLTFWLFSFQANLLQGKWWTANPDRHPYSASSGDISTLLVGWDEKSCLQNRHPTNYGQAIQDACSSLPPFQWHKQEAHSGVSSQLSLHTMLPCPQPEKWAICAFFSKCKMPMLVTIYGLLTLGTHNQVLGVEGPDTISKRSHYQCKIMASVCVFFVCFWVERKGLPLVCRLRYVGGIPAALVRRAYLLKNIPFHKHTAGRSLACTDNPVGRVLVHGPSILPRASFFHSHSSDVCQNRLPGAPIVLEKRPGVGQTQPINYGHAIKEVPVTLRNNKGF